jgi:hypothetical protein
MGPLGYGSLGRSCYHIYVLHHREPEYRIAPRTPDLGALLLHALFDDFAAHALEGRQVLGYDTLP